MKRGQEAADDVEDAHQNKKSRKETEVAPTTKVSQPSGSEETYKQVVLTDFVDKYSIPLSGADVYYMPKAVEPEIASEWYTQLNALETWYRPTLKVYGRAVTQSRAIAAYKTDESLSLRYSGQEVELHHPYPPLLQKIQDHIGNILGVKFNHVMLNRYEDGNVYIGKHSDDFKNKVGPVIASLSLGAERTFVMSPRKGTAAQSRRWVLENGSLVVMQGDTQRNWKHEIPKEPKIQEGRISLTFRQILP